MRIPEETTKAVEINIVPLIDIIFTIMVVFIVASLDLRRSQGLDVNLPRATNVQTRLQPDATVSITKDDQIAVNRQPTDLAGLAAAVQRVFAAKPTQGERLVVINADLALTHGRVIDVMDTLQQLPNVRLAVAARRTNQP